MWNKQFAFAGRGAVDGVAGPPPAWAPSDLFSGGVQGFALLASPSYTYTDTSLTTSAAVTDPIAGWADISGNGNNATQTTSGSRSILTADGSNYYADFDGTDDWLTTGSIDLTGTKQLTIWIGVRLDTNTANCLMCANGTGVAGGAGGFRASFDRANGAYSPAMGFLYGSTLNARYEPSPPAAPRNVEVYCLEYDFTAAAASQVKIRKNGSALTLTVAAAGPSENVYFTNSLVTIGALNGGGQYLDGRIYSIILRGSSSDSTEIAAAEAWTADHCGVTL